jgi:hypothetical protein
MAYVEPNFRTKRALREAVAKGEYVSAYQPGPFGGALPRTGKAFVEGPHYPAPHSWYAEIELLDGRVVKVK